MFAVNGMRTLCVSTSVNVLRSCTFLAQKFTTCTFNNSCNTSCLADRMIKPTRNNLNRPLACYSTNLKSSRPTKTKLILERKITSLETVQEQLKFFLEVKYYAETVNKIAILYNIAKIVERDEEQKEVLKQQHSTYMDLLNNISEHMSRCLPKNVPLLMWSLGINQVKHQKLVSLCEKKILSRSASVFNNENICQILGGCASLSMPQTAIFAKFEEAILNGEVKLSGFENHQLSGVILSFAKTDNGSVELFDAFFEEILSRDLTMMDSDILAEFVWSFAKKEFKADELFDRVEDEILRRETTDFGKSGFITMVLWAFARVGRGSKQLFDTVDNKLTSLGVEQFNNLELLDIVWSFGTRSFTKATAFDLVKQQLLKHGSHTLKTHELVLFLLSFYSAHRHDNKLITEIESELCLRNVKQISSTQLCQVVLCLAMTGKSHSQLFDMVQADVLQHGVWNFSKEEKFLLLRGYTEARRGSKEFHEQLRSSFSSKDFSKFSAREVVEFVCCFSEAGVEVGTAFNSLEKEILTKEKGYFSEKQLTSIKKSFQLVGKGTKELFEL